LLINTLDYFKTKIIDSINLVALFMTHLLDNLISGKNGFVEFLAIWELVQHVDILHKTNTQTDMKHEDLKHVVYIGLVKNEDHKGLNDIKNSLD
jgi:hypothetical protein